MITMMLKLKYRNPSNRRLRRQFDPDGGTLVFHGGGFGSRTNNSGKANNSKTLRPRRKSYGPF